MKKLKQRRTIIIMYASILAVIIGVTSSFAHFKSKPNPRTDWTAYYWFSPSGTYLRQNMVDNEIWLTGFDEIPYAPYTLKECGWAPGDVYGYPPTPMDPYNPSKRLYTHP